MLLSETREIGDFKIDDAYITFSFSENLATGHGPVYGHGAVRVEGYSNFLWMVLLSGPLALRPELDVYTLAHVLTLPFLLLLGLSTCALARRVTSLPWAGGCLLLVALDADLAAAALSGLETVPYTALLTLAFAIHLRAPPGVFTSSLTVPCFVLVALMRIDGFVPLGFVVGYEIASALVTRTFSFRRLLRWAGPGLAVYAAWFAWRWSYYGLPLPTTYHAKALLPAALPWHGLEYLLEWLHATGTWALAPFVGFAAATTRCRKTLALVAFVLVHIAYVLRVGGDWMPFSRFFLPITPLVIVLAASGLRAALLAARKRSPGATHATIALGVASFAFVAVRVDGHVLDTRAEERKRDTIRSWTSRVEQGLLPGVRLLGLVIRPGESLLTDYAGVFAFHTDATVIDLFGICNTAVAMRGDAGPDPAYGRFCPACYAEARPAYLHLLPPLVRPADAFADHAAVVDAVFRTAQLDRALELRTQYVTGRVRQESTRQGVFFLERRRDGAQYAPRTVAPGITVDYPFNHR